MILCSYGLKSEILFAIRCTEINVYYHLLFSHSLLALEPVAVARAQRRDKREREREREIERERARESEQSRKNMHLQGKSKEKGERLEQTEQATSVLIFNQ
jgi:hypothetical protein